MKATLKKDGYIEVMSETEEERAVLNVMAREDIDLAQCRWGHNYTSITFCQSFPLSRKRAAAADFRNELLGRAIDLQVGVEKLIEDLRGLWNPDDLAEEGGADERSGDDCQAAGNNPAP